MPTQQSAASNDIDNIKYNTQNGFDLKLLMTHRLWTISEYNIRGHPQTCSPSCIYLIIHLLKFTILSIANY